MTRRRPQLPNQVHQVVSYEDDVHAWMYLDQVDGVFRYEAFVVGYDETGSPSTLEFVIEEGAFDLSHFPDAVSWLGRSLRNREADEGNGDAADCPWASTSIRFGSHTPWDLTSWQWQALHAFCEEQERRLKRESRLRWTRRLRALGYDVIRSL